MLVLTFQIGSEAIGLDIRRVLRVIPRIRLRPLTGSPAWFPGVFVYRGRVIPVVDMPLLAGHGECPAHLSSRIILVPIGADEKNLTLVGLLAAQVAELRELNGVSDDIAVRPGTRGVDLGRLVPDGGGVIRLLDPDRLFPADARATLVAAAGAAVGTTS